MRRLKRTSRRRRRRNARRRTVSMPIPPGMRRSLIRRAKVRLHRHLDAPPIIQVSDTAVAALSYAYTQFADPSAWKFNKARQNWLIRNVWSDSAVSPPGITPSLYNSDISLNHLPDQIPDKYFPLVTRYLTDIKGGVRDVRYSLISMCLSVEPLWWRPGTRQKLSNKRHLFRIRGIPRAATC